MNCHKMFKKKLRGTESLKTLTGDFTGGKNEQNT
nr:MAG TPA: hypothetical protein [Caudoviricetes sp.]